MNFILSPGRQGSRFLSIHAQFPVKGRSSLRLQLASWRPGRYELANFAKNVRRFGAFSKEGKPLDFQKISKDCWEISCAGQTAIRISYEYFAATLDAGSTYCGKNLLYVNPVNCLVFDPEFPEQVCEVELDVPEDWKIGGSMKHSGRKLTASGYEELADSPFIASPDLEHHTVEIDRYTHHVWIQGRHTLNVARFLREAESYGREQIRLFGEMETSDYHYLFIFLPTRFHHGVEHAASTVIVMGPGEEFSQESRHQELLAISSHELFHYWNVKRIRPAELFPYDYTRENYSRLGYVYEGITTYYGDYMLLRSGVFNFDEYLDQFNADLQKHFDNEGRYHYSVAESSFDTWLDGYVPGVPGRKVSIYTEGMLAAFMLDLEIRYATDNRSSLDQVMQALYDQFYKAGIPYTESGFKSVIEQVAGKPFDFFFRDFYWGKGKIEQFLPDSLWSIGCELVSRDSEFLHESRYGFKLSAGPKVLVTHIAENSPAERSGLSLNDEILLINNTQVMPGSDWNSLFKDGANLWVWNSIEGNKHVEPEPDGKSYYLQYRALRMKETGAEQERFFRAWAGAAGSVSS